MRVVRKKQRADYDAERRYDQFGEFRLMAEAEGYVLCRRKGRTPVVMTRERWDRFAREPVN